MKEDLEFYERMIFEWSKDSIKNTNELRNTYIKYDGLVNWQKIYRAIVDYRIEKYGTSSIVQWRGINKQDAYKINDNARRRYKKKLERGN